MTRAWNRSCVAFWVRRGCILLMSVNIALARTVYFVKCAGILLREAGPEEKIHSVAMVTGTGNTSTMLSVNMNTAQLMP